MIHLRPYQIAATTFFHDHDRAILADEPGMGKSHPAVYAAMRASVHGPWLLICPAYLVRQWAELLVEYSMQLYDGFCPPVLKLYQADRPVPEDYRGWIITGYHTFTNAGIAKHPELATMKFAVVIADEAHRLRGRRSQWTKHITNLRTGKFWMLTGTPIVNNPTDLWPLLRICDRKAFASYWRFVATWCATMVTPWATEIVGITPGQEAAFNDLLAAYLLRRRVEDHLPEIPKRIGRTIPVELMPSVRKAHDLAKKEWFIQHPDLSETVIATSGGALVHKLRALTAGTILDKISPEHQPKFFACKEYCADRNEPIVCFTYYRETANALARYLAEPTRPVFLATGAESPTKRAENVEAWKRSTNGILVATISALQEGANLQVSRTVVFVEHSYLPTDMDQAIARVRRFGQDRPVDVVNILCPGTVDDAVLRVSGKRGQTNMRALIEDMRLPALPQAA